MSVLPNSGPKDDRSLVAALQAHARERADKTALIELRDGEHESARLTYAQLLERIQAGAAMFQRRGYAGRPVIIACRPGADYLIAVLACMFAGAIAVPMPEQAGRTSARWTAVLREVKPAAIVVEPSALGQFPVDGDAAVIPLAYGHASDWLAPEIATDTPAFVQFTSGSTGAPKGAVISHGALTATRAMIHQAFDHRPDWICVTWLPPWHDMGLVGGLLQPLGAGLTVVILPPLTVVQRPLRWLRAIDHYRANVSGGPVFGFAACTARSSAAERATLDLSCWQLAFCGAEPISVNTLVEFADAFAPAHFSSAALYACYGLAEATLFVTGRERGSGIKTVRIDRTSLAAGRPVGFAEDGREIASCGRAWGDGSIAIIDPIGGFALPPGALGEICVQGPHLASGYWGIAADPAFADGDGEDKLRTGDLGFLHAGELYVTGRLKEIIIIRGAKYHSEDIEDQVRQAHPALLAHGVAAFAVEDAMGESAVIVAETRRCNPQVAAEIELAIGATILRGSGLRVKDVVLVRPGTLPRTTSGKIERFRCREGFAQDRFITARARTPTTASDQSR